MRTRGAGNGSTTSTERVNTSPVATTSWRSISRPIRHGTGCVRSSAFRNPTSRSRGSTAATRTNSNGGEPPAIGFTGAGGAGMLTFRNVVVAPYTDLLLVGPQRAVHRGGPAWPDFDNQRDARHQRG